LVDAKKLSRGLHGALGGETGAMKPGMAYDGGV